MLMYYLMDIPMLMPIEMQMPMRRQMQMLTSMQLPIEITLSMQILMQMQQTTATATGQAADHAAAGRTETSEGSGQEPGDCDGTQATPQVPAGLPRITPRVHQSVPPSCGA